MKKRVLFYGESPHNTTGFANVNKHLASAIAPVCELEYVASSHWGHTGDAALSYKIHQCPPGTEKPQVRNLDKIMERLESREWDMFFYSGDVGANDDVILRACQIAQEDESKYTIYYVPLDIDECMPQLFDMSRACHVQVFYTFQAVKIAEKLVPEMRGKVSAIGLGTEPDVFYSLSRRHRQAQRARIFNIHDDETFIIINVNRNQMRKDLARSMAYYHKFHEKHPNSLLYMHSVVQDYGGNLMTQATMVGCNILAQPSEIAFSGLDLNKPWSREDLNNLYNAADCLISTSYGEGWGLTTTEAMCAGCPVVVPGNTANIDIVGENEERGYLMKTGGDLDHTAYLYEGGGAPHDVVHFDSFMEKLERVYLNRQEAIDKTEVGRDWCFNNTWEHRGQAWRDVITILSGEK